MLRLRSLDAKAGSSGGEGGWEAEEWALLGGRTSWDLRLEEGVVEAFWILLEDVKEAAAWDWRFTSCS